MNGDARGGNLVIGIMLVVLGAGIALDRAGIVHWSGMWSLWPLILGGIGLARFIQSPPGEPKEGLVFMTLAAWLLVSEAGYFALQDSWPLLVIAIGLIIAFNGGPRRRWHGPQPPDAAVPGTAAMPAQRWPGRRRRSLTPLAVVGIWIAIFAGFQMSGVRSWDDRLAARFADGGDRVRIVSVMGRSDHSSRDRFRGADIMNVMGRSELDLREATLAPGARASVHVVSLMGGVILRVPPTWRVDTGAISAMGGVQDDRAPAESGDTAAGPPPRLTLDGVVMMGRLTIR
jgi:hypothetical protein